MKRFSFVYIVLFLVLCGCAQKDIVNEESLSFPIRQSIEGKNYGVPYFTDNMEAKDCTYEELISFLKMDKTDQLVLSENKKNLNPCEFYAVTLHDNAEKVGIRCGFAIITFVGVDPEYGRYGHAVDVFHTMDKGAVYIDDTKSFKDVVPSGKCSCNYSFDKIAKVVVGEEYVPKRLFNFDGVVYKPMGIVESIDTYWNELDK